MNKGIRNEELGSNTYLLSQNQEIYWIIQIRRG